MFQSVAFFILHYSSSVAAAVQWFGFCSLFLSCDRPIRALLTFVKGKYFSTYRCFNTPLPSPVLPQFVVYYFAPGTGAKYFDEYVRPLA